MDQIDRVSASCGGASHAPPACSGVRRRRLTRMMIDAELNKRYSVEGLLTELEKIKIMVLPDGGKVVTEITKKQREILDALHMCA